MLIWMACLAHKSIREIAPRSSSSKHFDKPMRLYLDPIEAQVAAHALGQAVDNERDKGDEGLGLERIERLEEILTHVDNLVATNHGGAVEVDFLALDVLAQYLPSLEGLAGDVDGFGPEHEEARKRLITLLGDDFGAHLFAGDKPRFAPSCR